MTTAVLGTGDADLHLALDLVPEPVVIVDSTDVIRWANIAAVRLVAPELPDLVGLSLADALGGSERLEDIITSSIDLAGAWRSGRMVVLGGLAQSSSAEEPGLFVHDRAALFALMDEVHPAETLGQTASSLCRAFERLDWVDGAIILLSPGSDEFLNITEDVEEGLGFSYGGAIPVEQVAVMIAAAEAGSWTLDMTDPATAEIVGSGLVEAILSVGIRGAAYAGIRLDGELAAVLSIGSFRGDAAAFLQARLGRVEELARLAGVVMRTQALQFARVARLKSRIRSVIDTQGFRSVFMPVVDIHSREIVGYEALTRFEDGRPPEEWFAEAAEAGVSVELDVACARSSIDAAGELDRDVPLSLNFSPVSIISGRARELVLGIDRPIVLEVTEHARIDSYEEMRAAVARIPGVTLAVDDAGAGFASLRHILELKPDFVKLDMGLIRGVDVDPARAALIAGVVHFANQTGTRLVAEGVETATEAETLLALGVRLAQGSLFFGPV